MALAALCDDDSEGRLWADVLQSRFAGNGPLAGHAIGNLLIAGLWQRLGDRSKAWTWSATCWEYAAGCCPCQPCR